MSRRRAGWGRFRALCTAGRESTARRGGRRQRSRSGRACPAPRTPSEARPSRTRRLPLLRVLVDQVLELLLIALLGVVRDDPAEVHDVVRGAGGDRRRRPRPRRRTAAPRARKARKRRRAAPLGAGAPRASMCVGRAVGAHRRRIGRPARLELRVRAGPGCARRWRGAGAGATRVCARCGAPRPDSTRVARGAEVRWSARWPGGRDAPGAVAQRLGRAACASGRAVFLVDGQRQRDRLGQLAAAPAD